jgi:hypothetical protein
MLLYYERNKRLIGLKSHVFARGLDKRGSTRFLLELGIPVLLRIPFSL